MPVNKQIATLFAVLLVQACTAFNPHNLLLSPYLRQELEAIATGIPIEKKALLTTLIMVHYEPSFVFIGGSRSRGYQTPSSDIDIFLDAIKPSRGATSIYRELIEWEFNSEVIPITQLDDLYIASTMSNPILWYIDNSTTEKNVSPAAPIERGSLRAAENCRSKLGLQEDAPVLANYWHNAQCIADISYPNDIHRQEHACQRFCGGLNQAVAFTQINGTSLTCQCINREWRTSSFEQIARRSFCYYLRHNSGTSLILTETEEPYFSCKTLENITASQ